MENEGSIVVDEWLKQLKSTTSYDETNWRVERSGLKFQQYDYFFFLTLYARCCFFR